MPRVIYEPRSRTSSIMRIVGLAVAVTAAALGATAGEASDDTQTAEAACATPTDTATC